MKLNNKGFTLVEVLAVVVILSIIIAIMVPNVNYLIDKQKEETLKSIKNSINSAATVYISDNKYEVNVLNSCPDNPTENDTLEVTKDDEIIDSKISVSKLMDLGNLKRMDIKNPKTDKLLNTDASYAEIKYDCTKKDLIIKEIQLVWN